jgi:hypothetical protein
MRSYLVLLFVLFATVAARRNSVPASPPPFDVDGVRWPTGAKPQPASKMEEKAVKEVKRGRGEFFTSK